MLPMFAIYMLKEKLDSLGINIQQIPTVDIY